MQKYQLWPTKESVALQEKRFRKNANKLIMVSKGDYSLSDYKYFSTNVDRSYILYNRASHAIPTVLIKNSP